jgi:hypothetical protein
MVCPLVPSPALLTNDERPKWFPQRQLKALSLSPWMPAKVGERRQHRLQFLEAGLRCSCACSSCSNNDDERLAALDRTGQQASLLASARLKHTYHTRAVRLETFGETHAHGTVPCSCKPYSLPPSLLPQPAAASLTPPHCSPLLSSPLLSSPLG